ncbi:monooxygenase, FAD-binding [Actinokineospora spheciospongiae]|uniref:Monooxygenase, FAD-binding n=1 Tax=Actinokineospora spheciospongiae TaxID=909613 RepID=W7IQ01_9PSEU|nr:NAD(P)/FAD-dependent oxidoreductase [Actinokineospora spheciospongiae]EWC62965.1 monooxygenase, FAD-binding [Actinokineospora spheciospongiae]
MYDAVVIGGRCAGAAVGTHLARQGRRVLVVDRSRFPSDVLSTHFIWPHGASHLNRLGVLDQVRAVTPAHTEVTIVNDGIALRGSVPEELLRNQFRLLHGDDHGITTEYFSVRRHVLDKILIDNAVEAGVEFREGYTVKELLRDDDGTVVGIEGRDGTVEHARVVVGADGRNSFVARALGIGKSDERPRCTFAYWSYFSGIPDAPAQIHRRGRLGMAMASTNHGRTMVLAWGPSEWAAGFRADVEGNFHRALGLISEEAAGTVAAATREERFYGTLDQAAYLRQLHGPGWVLVGDAESFKDQCTALGITHALRDAELAAAAIGRWLGGESDRDTAMAGYAAKRRSQTAAAYYDYVCTLAEMKPLRHDELQLFSTLRGNQAETDRFIATHVDVAPVSEFFDPSNVFLLNDTARESSRDHGVFADFEATYRDHHRNPFQRAEAEGTR